jgi:hypothetical protein
MNIVVCERCGTAGVDKVGLIPGSQTRKTWNCLPHEWSDPIGTFNPRSLVHYALSTLMRSESLGPAELDHAHVLQDWLCAPRDPRITWPMMLADGYGVSSIGLSAARLVASTMARGEQGLNAVRWRSAAMILRRKLG